MSMLLLSRVRVSALALSMLVGAALADPSSQAPATTPSDPSIGQALGLRAWRTTDLSVSTRDGGETYTIRGDADGRAFELALHRVSVRAPGYQVMEDAGAGLIAAAAPTPTTYRGVDTATGDPAAATILDGHVSATVRPHAGEAWHIQPARDAAPGTPAASHVVYLASDVRGGDWTCAGGLDCHDCGPVSSALEEDGPAATCLRSVEILFDADYPFYQQRQSSTSAAVSDIEGIVNQVNLIYERDLGVNVAIRQTVVRTIPADPYADLPLTSVDPGALLGRLGTVWAAVPTPSRDLVHLMTGRDLASSTIGIAYVGVVCRSSTNNTGVSQSLFTTNLAMRTVLTAHELGHNFGSSHDSGGSYIMAPSTSPSSQQAFSPGSISVIGSYLSGSGACLTPAAAAAAPDAAQTVAGQSVLIDVLGNDDPGCGSPVLSLPSAATTGGGTVSISLGTGPGGRNQVRYAAPATVAPGGLGDQFTYRLTESGATVATGTVSVTVSAAPAACRGDFNRSGGATVQDIFDFLAAYFGDEPVADVNASGAVSVQDIFDFLADYFVGCP